MKRVLVLFAGVALLAGTAFATETTTRGAFVPKTTDGTIRIEKPEFEKTTEGAIKPPRPEGTTEGAIRPPRPEGTTEGAIRPERPEGTTEGAIKPPRPEGTTRQAIGFEKGKAYGHNREKNPVAEMNINKVKPAELTDAQKAELKAKFEEIKAAREKEEGKEGKKGKFGKGKK